MISDILPLFGYQKRYYMILYNILGLLGILTIYLLPDSTVIANPALPASSLCIFNIQVAAQDLLCEGKYVEYMRINFNSSIYILSYVWSLITISEFLPAITVGFISHYTSSKYAFLIMLPLSIQTLGFLLAGCMVSDSVPKEKSNKFDILKIKREYGAFMEAMIMLLFTIGTVFCGIFASNFIRAIYGIISAIITIASCNFFLPYMIANVNAFIFPLEVSFINIGGALEYFYTETPDCLIDVPHFDMIYYRTWTSLASIFATLIGIWCFQSFIVGLKYKHIFWISIVFRILGYIFDIFIVKRWNISIGINDHVMYFLGEAIISNVTYMLNTMPINILISLMCPPEIEATVYALLA